MGTGDQGQRRAGGLTAVQGAEVLKTQSFDTEDTEDTEEDYTKLRRTMNKFLAVLVAVSIGLGVSGCDEPKEPKPVARPAVADVYDDIKDQIIARQK